MEVKEIFKEQLELLAQLNKEGLSNGMEPELFATNVLAMVEIAKNINL